MSSQLPHITFVIHDEEGGVATMNHRIIENGEFRRYFRVHVLLWKNTEEKSKRFRDNFEGADDVIRFDYSKLDNYYFALKKLNFALNKWPGLIVTNDGIELESMRLFGTKSVVFAIVHDFYNLKLAVENRDLVDYFFCHTDVFTRTLLSSNALSDRVKYILHGVRLPPSVVEKKAGERLKVVSISRLTESKGVMDFFAIDGLLRQRGVGVDWVVIGSGVMEQPLREQWKGRDNIRFYMPDTQEEVMAIAMTGDIFISPSVFEGYGIALLEAMSTGLVPVIHRLPVGVYSDLPGDVGFSLERGDLEGFARHIEMLHSDRELLLTMGKKARLLVEEKYDISTTAKAFMENFKANTLPQVAKDGHYKRTGWMGLLDRSFVPNGIARRIKRMRT